MFSISFIYFFINPSCLRLALIWVCFSISIQTSGSYPSIPFTGISSQGGVGGQTISCVGVCACLWPSENEIVYKYLYIKSYIYVIETSLHHFRFMLILQIKILRKEQHILVCTIFLMHLYHDTIEDFQFENYFSLDIGLKFHTHTEVGGIYSCPLTAPRLGIDFLHSIISRMFWASVDFIVWCVWK